jgi:triacylglycerol lipase
MKKIITIVSAAIILTAGLLPVFAGGSAPRCKVKYPVILSHGMGYSAGGILGIGYWYNIPSELRDEGAQVYISDQTAMASTADRAVQLKAFVLQVLAVTGAAKVNIIGHSQGGLDARYMISNLGLSSRVASLTTMCTPHRGSAIADVILKLNGDMGGWITGLVDTVYVWLFGGTQNLQDTLKYCNRPYMINTFNPNTPDKAGVYYQSYAAQIVGLPILDKLVFSVSWALLKYYEGDNDGVVSVSSAKWTNFKGIKSGSILGGGVSHVNMVDQFIGLTPFFDAPGFFVDVVSNLKSMGY